MQRSPMGALNKALVLAMRSLGCLVGIQLGIWERANRAGDRDLVISTVCSLEEHGISWLREFMADWTASGDSGGLL